MRARWLIAGGVLLVVAVLAIALHQRVRIWWKLRGYTSDPGQVYLAHPDVCDFGDAALAPVSAAFDETPAGTNAQLVLAATLRCLRAERSPGIIDADVPEDGALNARLVRAYNEQPEEQRERLITMIDELDFRAQFALYAGIAAGPNEVPTTWPVPTVDPSREAPAPVLAARREEWCRVVAPLVRTPPPGVASSKLFDTLAFAQLGKARCQSEDIAMLVEIVQQSTRDTGDAARAAVKSGAVDPAVREGLHRGTRGISSAIEGLVAATSSPDDAAKTLAPLFAGPCGAEQPILVEHLAHRLSEPVAKYVGTAAARCMCPEPEPAVCWARIAVTLTRDE